MLAKSSAELNAPVACSTSIKRLTKCSEAALGTKRELTWQGCRASGHWPDAKYGLGLKYYAQCHLHRQLVLCYMAPEVGAQLQVVDVKHIGYRVFML